MIPDQLVTELQRRFGSMHHIGAKPFSTHYQNADTTVLVKVYRHVAPAARMVREVEALTSARQLGVRVPRLVDNNTHGDMAWTAVTMVPGEPLPLYTAADVNVFAITARRALAPLHTRRLTRGPGTGWTGPDALSISSHLAGQFRAQFRALPAWPRLLTHLRVLDTQPVVRLHGDVKPEHLLVDSAGVVTVVDWEAAYRGPATLDESDIVFRVIREVAYTDLSLTTETLALLPWTHAHMTALKWRIAVWLDRRHDFLTDPVAALVEQITELPNGNQSLNAVAAIMQAAREEGTAY